MNIHFESHIADEVGVDGAIMITNLEFWIKKNEANNKHFYDGHYWTYNSKEAFSKLFTFWTIKQIRRIIDNLERDGYIIKGNFNKQGYDRTTWYALTEKAMILINPLYDSSQFNNCPNGQMELPKQADGIAQMDQPIPYINTDSNTNNTSSKDKGDRYLMDIEEIWSTYPNKKGKTKAIKKIGKLLKQHSKDELLNAVKRYSVEVKNTDKQFIKHGDTFFNGAVEDYLEENYQPNIKPKVIDNNSLIF